MAEVVCDLVTSTRMATAGAAGAAAHRPLGRGSHSHSFCHQRCTVQQAGQLATCHHLRPARSGRPQHDAPDTGRLLLCCAVLCCPVLPCAVLCCALLCYAVPCCAALRHAALRCAALCCAVLCCDCMSTGRYYMQSLHDADNLMKQQARQQMRMEQVKT